MAIPIKYNLRSLMRRKVRTLLTVMSICLVVFVAILMISFSRGIIQSLENSASPNNVMVLSKGAETLEFSAVEKNVLGIIENSSYVSKPNGFPLVSPELYLATFIRLPDESKESQHLGVVRGVRKVALQVHDQVQLVAGRLPKRGFEVMVGRLVATKLGASAKELSPGSFIYFENQKWTVVGQFKARGTGLESEIWTNVNDLMVASKRNEFSCITMKCDSPEKMRDALFDLATRTDVLVEGKSEAEYYRAYAKTFQPVKIMTWIITILLVMGGVIAGMNTMFTAVSGRVREIGTLRVLGFKSRAIMLSFLLEAILISITASVIASALALLLNGLPLKIPLGAFRFHIDWITIGIGFALSILIGILGSVIPVIRAGRLKTVEAIRAI